MLPIRWNLWNYLLDRECIRNDCWTEDEYIIVWDWQHRVPRVYNPWQSIQPWYRIKIVDWKITVDTAVIPTTETIEEDIADALEDAWIPQMQADIEELKADNPEEVRFLLVQMDGDKETTVQNAWIDDQTDATPTWISWSPNWIIEIYVGNWYITIVSSENENWVVRLRLSKAKQWAFLNSL